MRFFEASPWRFPSLLHARGETTGVATQRSRPSVLHLRTGVRIPPPPDFARADRTRASSWQACLAEAAKAAKADPVVQARERRIRAKSVTPKRQSREGGPPSQVIREGGLQRGFESARSLSIALRRRRARCDHSRMISSPHIVYVLESIAQPARHYTGLTTNANNRVARHNAGLSGHTSKHRPWKLLVSIEFADPERALRFEKDLKTGSGRAFARRHFGSDSSSREPSWFRGFVTSWSVPP